MWNLVVDDSLKNHKPPTGRQDSIFLGSDGQKGHSGLETSVIGSDHRRPVNLDDIGPNGKYRCKFFLFGCCYYYTNLSEAKRK